MTDAELIAQRLALNDAYTKWCNDVGRKWNFTGFLSFCAGAKYAQPQPPSDNHPSKQEGDVLTVCTLCGEQFYQSAKVALAMQCRARCEACKRKRRK